MGENIEIKKPEEGSITEVVKSDHRKAEFVESPLEEPNRTGLPLNVEPLGPGGEGKLYVILDKEGGESGYVTSNPYEGLGGC
jgi:hypothetical protein